MKTHVEFTSSSFPKYENEDEETVNPERWGKRLAEYFRDELPAYGVATKDILCEDWGWLVYIENSDFPLWIGCGPVDDIDEDGNVTYQKTERNCEFAAFITAEPSVLKKLFRKVDISSAIERVSEAMQKMFEDRDDFSEVTWTN